MSARVRFAPSPTGHLHVGGARTALFNWLIARSAGGTFVLRIEDTDRARSSEKMVQGILTDLEWLGLECDEGPFFQSDGIGRHRADVEELLQRGFAYRDFTSAEELAQIRKDNPDEALRYPRRSADRLQAGEADRRTEQGEPHAVRFRVPDGETSWDDGVHGVTRFQNGAIEDLVLLRADGTPTYNLAVASDDAHMGITRVVRGDDHLSNTPKQILILESLGRAVPEFAHVPMILGSDGKRLSKRHGAASVSEYAARGILPEAMVNFLALLGWSPGSGEEILTRGELIRRFSLDRVLKKSAVFDLAKLEWLNGQHLSRIPGEQLAVAVLEELKSSEAPVAALVAGHPQLVGIIDLLKTRARSAREIAERAVVYADGPVRYEPEAVDRFWSSDPETTRGTLAALAERFKVVSWEEPALEAALRDLAEERGVGAGKLIHPLRVALTGQGVSPGIFEVLYFLGRDLALFRIDEALESLRTLQDPFA